MPGGSIGGNSYPVLGKTRAETHIDEALKTVDVTLYFTGAAPAPDRRRPGVQ